MLGPVRKADPNPRRTSPTNIATLIIANIPQNWGNVKYCSRIPDTSYTATYHYKPYIAGVIPAHIPPQHLDNLISPSRQISHTSTAFPSLPLSTTTPILSQSNPPTWPHPATPLSPGDNICISPCAKMAQGKGGKNHILVGSSPNPPGLTWGFFRVAALPRV